MSLCFFGATAVVGFPCLCLCLCLCVQVTQGCVCVSGGISFVSFLISCFLSLSFYFVLVSGRFWPPVRPFLLKEITSIVFPLGSAYPLFACLYCFSECENRSDHDIIACPPKFWYLYMHSCIYIHANFDSSHSTPAEVFRNSFKAFLDRGWLVNHGYFWNSSLLKWLLYHFPRAFLHTYKTLALFEFYVGLSVMGR